jgi:hypothetical protein
MKKFFIVIGIIFLLFVVLRMCSNYSLSTILSNEAAFKVYLDIDERDFDSYFRLEKGTYDPNKHRVICQLPVSVDLFEPKCQDVYPASSIHCGEVFEKAKYRKYAHFELKDTNFKLLLVENIAGTAASFDPDHSLYSRKIVASHEIPIKYSRGKINHIVIGDGEAYEYCSKKQE